jgi:hypothetical protein
MITILNVSTAKWGRSITDRMCRGAVRVLDTDVPLDTNW